MPTSEEGNIGEWSPPFALGKLGVGCSQVMHTCAARCSVSRCRDMQKQLWRASQEEEFRVHI